MAWLEYLAKKRPINQSAGNFSLGGMTNPLRGLVLHIQAGTENGTFNWFNTSKQDRQTALEAAWVKLGSKGKKPVAGNSSAHFGNPKKGQMEQFIDTANLAFAQKAGNHAWLSVENEGNEGDSLSPSQLNNLAQLMAYLNVHEGVPLQEADTPSKSGLGYHGMGGIAWGGHFHCPGLPIINQRSLIIRAAQGILLGTRNRLEFDPTGRWQVKVAQWVWNYTFAADGKVTWVDPLNGLTGAGKWKVNEQVIAITWAHSTTKDTWQLPLSSQAQQGKCVMKGKVLDLNAVRL